MTRVGGKCLMLNINQLQLDQKQKKLLKWPVNQSLFVSKASVWSSFIRFSRSLTESTFITQTVFTGVTAESPSGDTSDRRLSWSWSMCIQHENPPAMTGDRNIWNSPRPVPFRPTVDLL